VFKIVPSRINIVVLEGLGARLLTKHSLKCRGKGCLRVGDEVLEGWRNDGVIPRMLLVKCLY